VRKIILLTVTFNFTSAVVGPEFEVTQKIVAAALKAKANAIKSWPRYQGLALRTTVTVLNTIQTWTFLFQTVNGNCGP